MILHISLQNEREEVERQKEYFSKLRADFQPDGQRVRIIALEYSGALYLMQTPWVPHCTCGMWRRPYLDGLRYIFSRRGNTYSRYWALRLVYMRTSDSVQLLNQPAVPDNLAWEACHHAHYPVNNVHPVHFRSYNVQLLIGIRTWTKRPLKKGVCISEEVKNSEAPLHKVKQKGGTCNCRC